MSTEAISAQAPVAAAAAAPATTEPAAAASAPPAAAEAPAPAARLPKLQAQAWPVVQSVVESTTLQTPAPPRKRRSAKAQTTAKPAAKPAVKAAAKPLAKPAAKPKPVAAAASAAIQARPQAAAQQGTAKIATTTPATLKPPLAALDAAPAKPKVPRQPAQPVRGKGSKGSKLVRDSFAMPRADFALLQQLKQRLLASQRATKKSELLRAGLQVLAAQDDAGLQALLDRLPVVKAGRPRRSA